MNPTMLCVTSKNTFMKKFIIRANIIKNLFPTIFKNTADKYTRCKHDKKHKKQSKMKKIKFDTKINKKRCTANIL